MREPFARTVAIPHYDEVVRRAIFDACRWSTQRGDGPTLAPFALVLPRQTWRWLATTAEALACEATSAEQELLSRPDLHRELGLPIALQRVLADVSKLPTAGPVRFMRFDFHPTVEGLRITEGNLDVCGGFIESAGVAPMVAEQIDGVTSPADPALALAEAIRGAAGEHARVGLMHLSIFTEDRQVVSYLARRMAAVGLEPSPFHVGALGLVGDLLVAGPSRVPLDFVFRFFPSEWLPRLSRRSGWPRLLTAGATPVANPGWAVLSQSKRFPLVFGELSTALPTWRALLPETRTPTSSVLGDDWVLKPALGHEGYLVSVAGVGSRRRRERLCARAVARPDRWVMQRRFVSCAIDTPFGPRHVCVGVFIVNGRAAGAYARAATRPLIDDGAQDVIVLVEEGA